MLVSEIRRKVKQMPSDGLSLNEIAHRLGVARATVGYRVQVLDEAQRGPVGLSATRYTGPVAPPSVPKARVSRALEAGHNRASVAQQLGLSRSAVTYRANQLGMAIDERCARRYDWQVIRRYYEAGHSVAECRSRFGFNRQAWHSANRAG